MAFAVCIAVGYAGAVGALAAMIAFFAIGTAASRWRWVQIQLEKQIEYREQQRREAERMRKLKPAGPVRQQQYADLRDLVTEIEHLDGSEASRFELQDLLEHFIRLSISHQRCVDSLRLAGSHDLPRPIAEGERSARRRDIMLRRERHREDCVKRIERLSDELEAIDELVRLVAQRVACPAIDHELDREIDRRLWELDEVDDAMKQLSA